MAEHWHNLVISPIMRPLRFPPERWSPWEERHFRQLRQLSRLRHFAVFRLELFTLVLRVAEEAEADVVEGEDLNSTMWRSP